MINQEEINYGNELIAKFMGGVYAFAHITDQYNYMQTIDGVKLDNFINDNPHKGNDSNHIFSIEELKFDSDWNWMMSVIQKIKSTPSTFWAGMKNSLLLSTIDIDIMVLWLMVVDFVKWYNKKYKIK